MSFISPFYPCSIPVRYVRLLLFYVWGQEDPARFNDWQVLDSGQHSGFSALFWSRIWSCLSWVTAVERCGLDLWLHCLGLRVRGEWIAISKVSCTLLYFCLPLFKTYTVFQIYRGKKSHFNSAYWRPVDKWN